MTTTNEKRTTTTTTQRSTTNNDKGTSSSSTRVRAREEARLTIAIEELRRDHQDILGRAMPRFTERQLQADLEEGTPAMYYSYALQEAASAPMPSWRYVLAIVSRLKRQQVPEEELLWWS